jgi:hypothetical protein
MTAQMGTTLDRLEMALRSIRVLRSGETSPGLTGVDLEFILTWKARASRMFADVVNDCIAILDELAGDPEAEDDGTAEPDGTEIDQSWHEGYSRRAERIPWKVQAEDVEQCDPLDTSGDEGEPDFRKRHKRLLREAYGPGCLVSDSDYGAEEAGERNERPS